MKVYAACDTCAQSAPCRKPGIYHLIPEGWLASYPTTEQPEPLWVCSQACSERAAPELVWKLNNVKQRDPVGREACGWCAKLKRTCPGHARQEAKEAKLANKGESV